MKKGIVLGLVFFLAMVFVRPAVALTAAKATPISSAAAQIRSELVQSQEQAPKINYALPYPGMLPDSPLYFLKVLRDKIITFLIQSADKKAFYLLLASDKRLAAGEILVNTGKTSLGVVTLVDGENYFSNAVDQAARAKQEKKDVGELLAKLTVAASKHQEVIGGLATKVTGVEATRLATAYSENQNSQNRVRQLSMAK